MTTRRNLLAGLAVVAVPLPAIAASEAPEERVQRLTAELAAAMADLRGSPMRTYRDHYGTVIVSECTARLRDHRRVDEDGERRWPA